MLISHTHTDIYRKKSTFTSAAAAFPPGDHPCLPGMATKADRRRRRSNRRAVRRRAGGIRRGRIWWSISENRRVGRDVAATTADGMGEAGGGKNGVHLPVLLVRELDAEEDQAAA